jgi:hypothetical protein
LTKSLPIDLLRIDAGTQSRVSINQDVVEDYAELIAQANGDWPFGTIEVFHDGNHYMVADGFHRTLAAVKAKRSSVPCNVHKGTAKDALIFGMTANDKQGMRMTRADKRHCVEWLLDNDPKMTQAEVAEKSGVSLRTVKRIVADRKPSVLGQKVPLSPNFQGDAKSISAKGKPGGGATNTSSETTPVSLGPASGEAANSGEEESPGTKPQDHDPRPPRSGKERNSAPEDFGVCPNCAGTKWTADEFGVSCAKCHHPHGEPLGDSDETGQASKAERANVMRLKLIKTVEACQRAVDDMNDLVKRPVEHKQGEALTKQLLRLAKGWPA